MAACEDDVQSMRPNWRPLQRSTLALATIWCRSSATLSEVDLDLAILGVDAFDPLNGAKALDEEEARVNTLMVARARQVAIVADSSKLSARAFARICAVSDINYFITDKEAPEDVLNQLRAAGVTVIVT